MGQKKLIPQKSGQPDDYQTPKEALLPLLSYIDKDWIIWECAAGNGNLVNGLEEKGYKVIGTDILTDKNFLFWQPEKYDCIITNPPFSLKLEFLKRCYSLGKPWAFLLPYTTFDSQDRQALFRKYGVELICFDKRINFEVPTEEGSVPWFGVAWFTYGLNLPHQLIFVEYKPDDWDTTQITLL